MMKTQIFNLWVELRVYSVQVVYVYCWIEKLVKDLKKMGPLGPENLPCSQLM